MSRAYHDSDEDWQALEAPFLDLDPELNVYALANGLDLLKNDSGRPDRTLEWYRDRMERRVRLVPVSGPPPCCSVQVGASRKEEGVDRVVLRTVLERASWEDLKTGLRGLLAEAVDRANDLTPDDLGPAEPST